MIASTGILLMAAGLSSRYRQLSGQHKLQTTPADGTPLSLLERNLHLATTVAGGQVNVVLRPEDRELIALARRYHCAVTLLASRGLGSSIAAGVANRPWWTGWLVIERSRDAKEPTNVKKNFSANTAYVKSIFQHGNL